MIFKEEYKKEMQKLSPSEEQCKRIRQGVMQKLSDNTPEPSGKKKPLYLKIAAISGTAVCAAAVMIVIFGGFRGFNLMEGKGNDLAVNSSKNDYQSWGAANEPSYNNTGAAGGAQAPTMDSSSDADAMYDPNNNTNNEPSAAPQHPNIGNMNEGSPGIPYLEFSEDKEVCEVTINDETVTYKRVDVSVGGAGRDKPLISVRSEPGTELFVYFDNDVMEIYTKDGAFFGAYIK